MTLKQELELIITELDSVNAPDSEYKKRFSTFVKKPLRKGETWRSRLINWSLKA